MHEGVVFQPNEASGRGSWLAGLAMLLALGMVTAVYWFQFVYPIQRLNLPPALDAAAFAEATGVEVNLVAITGAGGFVDFRVKVVDAEQATAVFADPANIPMLIVEKDGTQLQLPEQSGYEGDTLENGRAYYLLFPNVNGIVQPGDAISVLIGPYRHEPLPAAGAGLPAPQIEE